MASRTSTDDYADPLDGDRTNTPPPPYQLEDAPAHVFNSSHDPESTVLDADIPYAVRGK